MQQRTNSKIHTDSDKSSIAKRKAAAWRNEPERGPALQRVRALAMREFSVQSLLDPSAGGEPLPERIRAHHEGVSGLSLADARLFRNSAVPQKWGAAALSFRNHVFVAPGQERHTAHEAWHLVQQKQGRVPADFHMGPVGVNTDRRLELEADQMGARTQSSRGLEALPAESAPRSYVRQAAAGGAPGVVQGYFTHGDDLLTEPEAEKIYDYLYRSKEEHKGRREFNSRRTDFFEPYDIDAFLREVARSDLNAAAILAASGLQQNAGAGASAAAAVVAAPPPSQQSADVKQAASARAIIWNVNHYGKPTRKNRAKLKAKAQLAASLVATNPDVILFNEVNAGVADLGAALADDAFAFETGPQLQALRKDQRPGQVEHYPLLYRKEKYEFVGASVATASGVEDAKEVFQWQKPKNRKGQKRKLPEHQLPEHRPLVIYKLKDRATKEVHLYGAVHTTPAGSEFKRAEVFSQVEEPLKRVREQAGDAHRLFVGGDYYLSPEAVVRKGGKQTRRNQTAPPLNAQLNLSAAMQPGVPAAELKPAQHVAVPTFITNPKDADGGQIADLAVLANWSSHRALLPNLQDPAAPQNVDAPDGRFTRALFKSSDHAPVIFDMSASADPLAAFQRVPPHDEAEGALRRARNRSLVLKTLIRAATASNAQVAPGSATDKYVDTLKRLLAALGKSASEATLAAIDGDSSEDQIMSALKAAGFGAQFALVLAEDAEFGYVAEDFELSIDDDTSDAKTTRVDKDGKKLKRRKKGK